MRISEIPKKFLRGFFFQNLSEIKIWLFSVACAKLHIVTRCEKAICIKSRRIRHNQPFSGANHFEHFECFLNLMTSWSQSFYRMMIYPGEFIGRPEEFSMNFLISRISEFVTLYNTSAMVYNIEHGTQTHGHAVNTKHTSHTSIPSTSLPFLDSVKHSLSKILSTNSGWSSRAA